MLNDLQPRILIKNSMPKSPNVSWFVRTVMRIERGNVKQSVLLRLLGCQNDGCEDHFSPPKTNRREWVRKIDANRERDARNVTLFTSEGWKVFRIWEHDIADEDTLKGIVLRVARAADTPDVLEFGRVIPRQGEAPERRRVVYSGGTQHPLSGAGAYHTLWHKLDFRGKQWQ